MSELQNENTEVLVSEDVVSTTPATEESKDDSLGKLGVALIGYRNFSAWKSGSKGR